MVEEGDEEAVRDVEGYPVIATSSAPQLRSPEARTRVILAS